MSEVPWPRTPWDPAKAALRPEVIHEIMEREGRRLLYERAPHTPERRRLKRAQMPTPKEGTERVVICGPKVPHNVTPCPDCGEPKGRASSRCRRCAALRTGMAAARTRAERRAARTAAPSE